MDDGSDEEEEDYEKKEDGVGEKSLGGFQIKEADHTM